MSCRNLFARGSRHKTNQCNAMEGNNPSTDNKTIQTYRVKFATRVFVDVGEIW